MYDAESQRLLNILGPAYKAFDWLKELSKEEVDEVMKAAETIGHWHHESARREKVRISQ